LGRDGAKLKLYPLPLRGFLKILSMERSTARPAEQSDGVASTTCLWPASRQSD
jgi:hypothetical protein